MGELYKFLFLTLLFLYFFKYSSEQIIIPLNPISEQNEPTIMTRETFTVQSNDGTPIRVTRIGFHRSSKNLNGGQDRQATPLDLMRLMDDRINSIFEEIISQRIGLRIIFNDINNQNREKEENKEENNNNNDNKEEKNQNQNQEIINDKEFELDEDIKEENSNDKNIEQEQKQNKTEDNKKDENKNDKENKKKISDKNQKEQKGDNKKATLGKLKVNPELLKPKKRIKKLSTKEIVFSRICKYIFYSIILFTIYILVRKLLEVLDIIDPESNTELKDVKVNNNHQEEKRNDDENKKKENEIILNKKKENNKLN